MISQVTKVVDGDTVSETAKDSKLALIDLAGSESSKTTGRLSPSGEFQIRILISSSQTLGLNLVLCNLQGLLAPA